MQPTLDMAHLVYRIVNDFDKNLSALDNVRNASAKIVQDFRNSRYVSWQLPFLGTLTLPNLTNLRPQGGSNPADDNGTPVSMVRQTLLLMVEELKRNVMSLPHDLDGIRAMLRSNSAGSGTSNVTTAGLSKEKYRKKQGLICDVLLAASDAQTMTGKYLLPSYADPRPSPTSC